MPRPTNRPCTRASPANGKSITRVNVDRTLLVDHAGHNDVECSSSRRAGRLSTGQVCGVHEPTDDDLAARQVVLQGEADRVAADLSLLQALSGLGDPIRVGSAALGLMVRRDLDITVVCQDLPVAAVARVGARLAQHPRVRQVLIRNDTGHWNTDLRYPDGLYLCVHYQSATGEDWTIDVWFVSEPDRQPDLAHLRALPARLTPVTRAAILRIKDAWSSRPEYGVGVCGYDIYMSVLDGNVRTADQFDSWCSGRRHLREG